MPSLFKRLICSSFLIAGFAVAAPAAQAGVLVATTDSCADQSLEQPFVPWADVASYTLSPGGSFEPGSRKWSLSGAQVVNGNEPYDVGTSDDSRSLSISSGGSAVSDPICVGIEHPDLRFFANASSPAATLNVDVLFEDSLGNVQSLGVGAVTGTTRWTPTTPFPLVVNLLPLLPGSHAPVAFRFSASGGSFQIDDVYVDPYARY